MVEPLCTNWQNCLNREKGILYLVCYLHRISTFLNKTLVLCPSVLEKRNVRITRILSVVSVEEYGFVEVYTSDRLES